MKRKTLAELIREYHELCSPGYLERLADRSMMEGLRFVGRDIGIKPGESLREPTPKDRDQLKLEKWLKRRVAALISLRARIEEQLKITDAEVKKERFSGFLLFLSVNFRVNGNEVEQRFSEIVMPSKITDEMIREAGREADECRQKVYRTNPDTISLNNETVERGFGLSGAAYHSSIPSGRLRKKGANLARS